MEVLEIGWNRCIISGSSRHLRYPRACFCRRQAEVDRYMLHYCAVSPFPGLEVENLEPILACQSGFVLLQLKRFIFHGAASRNMRF